MSSTTLIEITLDEPLLEVKFRRLEKHLSDESASIESERCYYCYDAPCVSACPTDIDIPGFIRALAVGQAARAAERIIQANPLGASCSRVCPVETLCEQACVRIHEAGGPVPIGLLQRYAMDHFDLDSMKSAESIEIPALHAKLKVAVVGAGPAGMTVAYLLAQAGFMVDVYEAQNLPGGLNESGIAAYKMLDDAAQREANNLLSHPKIHVHYGKTLGSGLSLLKLREEYSGVVLAVGLQKQRQLHIPGEDLPGVLSAIPYIAKMRRKEPVPVGKHVVVIGGGMTAIDIAIQIRLLGADDVHIAYRRGEEAMGASTYEQQLARDQGVFIHHYLRPVAIYEKNGQCGSIQFQPTHILDGQLQDQGEMVTWSVDQVFVAVGQQLDTENWITDTPELQLDSRGKILVDEFAQTSLAGIWAVGDCASLSGDLTVHAVADAKIAVSSMIADLASDMRSCL